MVPIVKAKPISTCVHLCVVRYTATNGPNPVCTSATKKLTRSRARFAPGRAKAKRCIIGSRRGWGGVGRRDDRRRLVGIQELGGRLDLVGRHLQLDLVL